MGGFGSGRHYRWDAKSTTDDMRSIDVRRWAREGLLNPGTTFGWRWTTDGETIGNIKVHVKYGVVRLDYRVRDDGGDWEPMDYLVRLPTTECHLGGYRRWFTCPVTNCGRRVAKLYGGRIFACRHCHRLAYPSQRETNYQRKDRRAQKIRDRLGWDSADDEYLIGKPKGMHWRTYRRLVAEMHRWDHESDAAFVQYFGSHQGHLGPM